MNIVEDGKIIPPQWRFRPITSTIVGLVAGVPKYVMPPTNDVIISYVTFTCALVLPFTITIIVDGTPLAITFNTTAGAIHYVYITTTADVLLQSTTITPFAQVQPIYARSFSYAVSTTHPVGAGGTGTVRWQSL